MIREIRHRFSPGCPSCQVTGDKGHVTGDKRPSYVPHMSLIWPSYGPNMALIWPLYGLIWPSYGPHMSLICPSMSLICTSYGPHRTLICPSNDPHMTLTWMSLMSLISLACCSSQPPPPPHSPPTRLLLFSRWRCNTRQSDMYQRTCWRSTYMNMRSLR